MSWHLVLTAWPSARGWLSLLLLVVLLALHHRFFGHPYTAQRLERARKHLRGPVLMLALIGPIWWGNQVGFGPFDEAVVLTLQFAAGLAGLALLLSAADWLPGRTGQATRLGIRVFRGFWLIFYPLMLSGVDLADPYSRKALLGILGAFLASQGVYAWVFLRAEDSAPWWRDLRRRLRPLAYLLLVGLVFYYAIDFWSLFPVTGGFVTDVRLTLLCLFLLLVSEWLLAVVFDYYYPEVRQSAVWHIYRDMGRAASYMGIAAFYYWAVLERDVDTILKSSAFFSVGLGLALKPTLGNMVAGLALRISEPYSQGHWIQVGDVFGKVTEISWRSTNLETLTGDILSLPNSSIARQPLINYSLPERHHALYLDFRLHLKHPPNQVRCCLLTAAAAVEDVLSNPAPEVYLMELSGAGALYRIRYFTGNFNRLQEATSDTERSLWYHLKRSGMEPLIPHINSIRQRPQPESLDQVKALLRGLDIFAALTEDELEILSSRARRQLYGHSEIICSQGDPGDSLYLLVDGLVRVTADSETGERYLDTQIPAGSCFGEMALLTGEPRSATIEAVRDCQLLTLGKADLADVLAANPRVREAISQVLAHRKLDTEQARERAEKSSGEKGRQSQEARVQQLSQQFLSRIKEFFSL